jgi:hypothetical protein
MMITGCSVNDAGLVRVRHLENESARVVQLDAWGLHLAFGNGDSGVTLGRDRRTYVFPRTPDATVHIPAELFTDPSLARVTDSGCPCSGLAGLGTPVAVVGRREGLGLDFDRARVGIGVGVRAHGAIRLEPDGDQMLFIRYDDASGRPPDVSLGKEIR